MITAASLSTPPKDLPPVSTDGIKERIPFRGVRRKIAQALDLSVKTAVHFTVVDEANVTAIDAKRREYAAVLGHKLSLLPFLMTAVCKGLQMHPDWVDKVVQLYESGAVAASEANLGEYLTGFAYTGVVLQDREALERALREFGAEVFAITSLATRLYMDLRERCFPLTLLPTDSNSH
mgnify:CR=1 FL=1